MPPKHKKRSCESVSVDIFSNLPRDVTDAILMCLPLRDTVRTSILSKQWRYKWCKLPEYLTLDLTHLTTKDLIPPIFQFTNIICHLLIFQHLVLELSSNGKLPSSVFKCLQLRHLTIRSCLIVSPPALKEFNRNVVEIKAPMLRSFDFRGSIQFIPLLAKISLIHVDYSAKSRICDIPKFFESFSVLENLHLDMRCLEFLVGGASGVPTRLIFLDKVDEIKSCPYLEYMEIDEIRQWQEDSPALPCLEMEGLSDVMFSHLKEVKLDGFLVTERGMQLIKLLLGKSPVLVRMLINTYTDDEEPEPGQLSESPSETNSFRAVVNAFLRASPKAELSSL